MPFTCLGVVLALLGTGLVLVLGTFTAAKGAVGGAGLTGSQPVVVAADDIAIRTPLEAKDVTIVKMAAADVPPGAFSKIDQVKGLVAAVQVAKGQPLYSNLLVKSADQVTGAQTAFLPLPTGWVAVTIPTSEQVGVGGFIQPGDYISLVAVVKVKGLDTQNVRTIYTNVHVLRVGPASSGGSGSSAPNAPPSGPTNSGTTGGVSSSLTIVVTQCQAEYITWFITNESLKYTLQSYKDYKPQDTSVDSSCPSVAAAGGVHEADIKSRWPGIASF